MQLFYDTYFYDFYLERILLQVVELKSIKTVNVSLKSYIYFFSSSYKCQAIEIKQMITSFAIQKPHLHIMIQF